MFFSCSKVKLTLCKVVPRPCSSSNLHIISTLRKVLNGFQCIVLDGSQCRKDFILNAFKYFKIKNLTFQSFRIKTI